MAHDLEKLLTEALALPAEARAALASPLLDSLDEPSIRLRRKRETSKSHAGFKGLDSGKAKAIPWAARRQISSILNGR